MAVKDLTAPSQPKGGERVMVPEAGRTVWASFYGLDTKQPLCSGPRRRVKHARWADIEVERRTDDVYAGTWPKWQQKWDAATPAAPGNSSYF